MNNLIERLENRAYAHEGTADPVNHEETLEWKAAASIRALEAERDQWRERHLSQGANRYWEGRWRDEEKRAEAVERERDAAKASLVSLKARFATTKAETIERCIEAYRSWNYGVSSFSFPDVLRALKAPGKEGE